MKKFAIIFLLAALLLNSSCGTAEITEGDFTEEISTEISTATTHGSTTSIYETGRYWTIYYDTDGSASKSIIFHDKNGEEIYHQPLDWTAMVMQIDENLFKIITSGGNGPGSTQFFDVEQGLVSPVYPYVVFADLGKVVHFDADDPLMLVVCSMFDSDVDRVTFKRDFCIYLDIINKIPSAYLTSEASNENSGAYPFTDIEFLDENRLYVKYLTFDRKDLDSGFDLVEEIWELN